MVDRGFMAQWLATSLETDEHIIAGFRGFTGPSRLWDLGFGIPLSALTGISVWHDYFYGAPRAEPDIAAAVLLPVVAFAVIVASAALRKSIYVAVTDRQIIVVQMSGRSRPHHLLFAAPIGSLRLTTTDLLGQRSITCAAADGGALLIGGTYVRLRLRAVGRRARFDGALAAFRAQGGSVDLRPLPPVPARLSGRRPWHPARQSC